MSSLSPLRMVATGMEMFSSTCEGTHASTVRDGTADVSPVSSSRTGSLFREPGTLLLRLKHTQMTTFRPFAKMQDEVTWSLPMSAHRSREVNKPNGLPRQLLPCLLTMSWGTASSCGGQGLPPERVCRVTKDRSRSVPPPLCQRLMAAAQVCSRGQPSDA